MTGVTILKVGGAIVENPESLGQLLNKFASIAGQKVLIHGGGRSATKMAARLGIETRMVEGRRITDADMLDVVTMVYGGLVNKRLVAHLQARGINAMGLCGADMNILRAHKRIVTDIDYGFVGDVDEADGKALQGLIANGIVPVIAPLTHDGRGQLLNTNADTIAAETAKSLVPYFAVTLIYYFEKRGVLLNPDDDDSVIPVITRADFQRLVAEGIVSDGMIPKLQNAFSALDKGIARVFINETEIKP